MTHPNLKKIRELLRGMSLDDLREVGRMVNQEWSRVEQAQVVQFRAGDRVAFKDRYGIEVVGTVIRVNKRTVSVREGPGREWRVAPSLLRRAS